ncbi:hypothetical protein Y032_0152g2860 [Ancylostoma ceylanicum]|uniref:Uncharacterized protein n=1 Tax=Ancylostoma ceylanicum TaxID=53326 RepID=A0A016T0N2_9BILA|nr:hypothetical protein Y032_0152g2860 [Ancylostoma ceylanicum]
MAEWIVMQTRRQKLEGLHPVIRRNRRRQRPDSSSSSSICALRGQRSRDVPSVLEVPQAGYNESTQTPRLTR